MSLVLVDTNVWVDHFRANNPTLALLLEEGDVLCHPIVVGELSMGGLRDRTQTLDDLKELGTPPVATVDETHRMVEGRRLYGRGIQWNDAQLLASAVLGGAKLWTSDRRLREIAVEMNCAFLG